MSDQCISRRGFTIQELEALKMTGPRICDACTNAAMAAQYNLLEAYEAYIQARKTLDTFKENIKIASYNLEEAMARKAISYLRSSGRSGGAARRARGWMSKYWREYTLMMVNLDFAESSFAATRVAYDHCTMVYHNITVHEDICFMASEQALLLANIAG